MSAQSYLNTPADRFDPVKRSYRNNYEHFEVEITDMLTSGNRGMAELEFTMTHEGEYEGIPPTGREVELRIAKVLTAAEGTKPHTQAVARVMNFLEKLGKEDVEQTKRRGKKLVVVDPEAADRYHDRCDRANEHTLAQSVMS